MKKIAEVVCNSDGDLTDICEALLPSLFFECFDVLGVCCFDSSVASF